MSEGRQELERDTEPGEAFLRIKKARALIRSLTHSFTHQIFTDGLHSARHCFKAGNAAYLNIKGKGPVKIKKERLRT